MIKSCKSVFFKKLQQKELMELRQTIKESLHQRKLKELEKLVQRYLLMIRPAAMNGRK